MKDYVESQTDLLEAFKTGGENITPDQAKANRDAVLISRGLNPDDVGIDEALEIVGDEHFKQFGEREIA